MVENTKFGTVRRGISNELRQPEYHETSCMYDSMTGLSSYYLFEDRLQTAIKYENHKDIRLKKNKIAVAVINIDNLLYFDDGDAVIREMSTRMRIYLPASYTLARGIRYTFWVMMPNMSNMQEIELELSRIRTIFRTPLKDNRRVLTSIGVSVYAGEGTKAKNMVEQAIIALQRAQVQGENNLLFYSGN